jgi:DNA mismatch endonuclease (patch repair protein)
VPDIVDQATRSKMMSGIRGRDTMPELRVRRWLHRRGYRYGLHARRLPGTPDIVLTRRKTVVLVHGCFWHRHARCRFASVPSTRRDFWTAKFLANVDRDARQIAELEAASWKVIVIWECETGSDAEIEAAMSALFG